MFHQVFMSAKVWNPTSDFSGTFSCPTHFMSSQVYFLAFSPRVILWIKTVCYTRAFLSVVLVSGHHSSHLLLTQITRAKCFLHVCCLDSCSEAVALPLVVSKKLISTMTLIDIWAPSSSISNLLINHMPAYPLQKLIRIICANNQKCNFLFKIFYDTRL